MLEIINLTKTYRVGAFGREKFHAVDNVSFTIKPGEILSLIGESGSGKTTIGKMILKLLKPTHGKIIYNDIDISSLKDKKAYYKNVQGIFQDPYSSYNPIFKIDRVFDMVREEFFPEVPKSEWKNKVIKVIEKVGMNPEQILNKFPHQLSGGQLQRLLIARALLIDAKFLVADEIISMLDASTIIYGLNELAKLKEESLSVLFITHDLSLGYYISDKAVILYRGSIMEYGSIEKVFKNPLHPYTKMLLQSVPTFRKKWADLDITTSQDTVKAYGGAYCKYYGRCAIGDENCKNIELKQYEEDHFAACIKIK